MIAANAKLAQELEKAANGEAVVFSDDPEEQEALEFFAKLANGSATVDDSVEKVPGNEE